MITAAIFDMDGLLFDSEPLWQEAEYQVFSRLGVRVTPELSAITAAMTTKEVTEFWYQQHPWQGDSLASVEQAVIDQVERLIKQKGEAKPGVKEILNFCKEQGLKIGLATNSPYQLIPVILDALEVSHYFDVITSSDQVEKGKPAPDVYLKTAQRLNVEPKRCMVFEDSPSGLAAGVAADMKVIVVPQKEHYDNPKFELSQFKLASLLDFTKLHLAALA
ncbi:HAD family hydrolase [Marinomonas sp. S3726]|uniref:hexitol phosphatase HxpB n=1 Tax=Marinomonas sp. S3726 TaxID=579484 RepID=UPI0005FA0B24|nr:hexitol phosphatase HxpB [Marinomonas sp. S3726]KJZ09266.1 HAD family hydrolase [Marinomonas sp. S3726]